MRTQLQSTAVPSAEIIHFSGNSYSQDNDMYDHLIPLLPPKVAPDRIFQVFTDEMAPEFPVGSIVGAKKIKLPTPFIVWGETYLLDTKHYGTIMRRVNTSDIPGCICCYADQRNYDPLDIPIDSIINVYRVVMMMKLV